jgi:hypothetical protein
MIQLQICKCPIHKDFWSVSIDDTDSGHGTRITPSKCCGQWRVIKAWNMDRKYLEEAANVMLEAAESAKTPTAVNGAREE